MQKLHTFDTNFIFRSIIIDAPPLKNLLKDLSNSDCIILWSIYEETTKLIRRTSFKLQKFSAEVKLKSFRTVINSEPFQDLKKEFPEIASLIEKAAEDNSTSFFDELIEKIQLVDLLIEKANLFPSTETEYLKIKQTKEYTDLINCSEYNKDFPHLALAEIWCVRKAEEKIDFVSCDSAHIVGSSAKKKVARIFSHIEPIHCNDWTFPS